MLLSLENVSFGYRGETLLKDISFSLHEGERVGFIGGNGEGKTTLLRLMLGQLTPDRGSIFRRNGLVCGYLEQSGGLESDADVYGAMEEVYAEDRLLIEKLSQTQMALSEATPTQIAALSSEIERLEKRIAARDSYHTDVRIRTVLGGMGFEGKYRQIVSTMSGGEKTRLKLCRLLLEQPELLILDEPTNHLDVKTLFWLEEYLESYRGALFVVSHDRYFLDRVTSRTLELENGTVCSFKGNYSVYKTLKEEQRKVRQREYERKCEEIAKLRDYVDRNLVRATTAKSAQSRVKKLEKLGVPEKPLPPSAPPRFVFSFSDPPYERVLDAPSFDLQAGERPLLTHASFTLMRGEKCALTGENGTGKTTLLKFLMSDSPLVTRGKFVKIAYYDQENADLDPDERTLDAFWGANPLMPHSQARNLLAQAGLSAEDVEKKVRELSGGLRAKLELALLESRRGNVLFLDEPTNHLDLPAREALEQALRESDCTILFVSHDRRFIEAVADKIALIENGKLSSAKCSYAEFLELQKQQTAPPPPKTEPAGKNGYRSKAERAKEVRLRTRMREIEIRLEAIEEEESVCNEKLAQCAADYKKVRELTERLDALRKETETLYEEYAALI